MSDIDTLRDLRAHAQMMVEHYGDADQKRKQNAALEAAGLSPLHSANMLNWDAQQGEKYQSYVATLDRVIAELGSRDSGYLHLGKAGAAIAMALDAKAVADRSEAA